jgi:glucosamine 6-phosphate synthetase-like amidotransferase/phosphosugar isomerase protein
MTLDSPLLGPDSPLDAQQQAVVARVSEAERTSILTLPTDDPLDPKRRHRVEATHGEMFGQPQAVVNTWRRNVADLEVISRRIAEGRFERTFLVGAGDSLAVMIGARQALELMTGVPCEPMQCLDFAYYHQHLVSERTMVIALSSSGETTRTVEAVLVAQNAGAYTLALTNSPGSSIDQESENTLVIEATRVGWPTQSSSAALALLLRLATMVGMRRGAAGASTLHEKLTELPDTMAHILESIDAPIAEVAAAEAARHMYLFSAAGPAWAAAIVGAAKVKETTPDHALEIQVEEYHHYNSQKPGEPLFLFAPTGPSVARAVYTGRDARRYGGRLYAVTTEGEHAFDEDANQVLELPRIPEVLSPLAYYLPAQMIGYHLGMAKFSLAESAARG